MPPGPIPALCISLHCGARPIFGTKLCRPQISTPLTCGVAGLSEFAATPVAHSPRQIDRRHGINESLRGDRGGAGPGDVLREEVGSGGLQSGDGEPDGE